MNDSFHESDRSRRGDLSRRVFACMGRTFKVLLTAAEATAPGIAPVLLIVLVIAGCESQPQERSSSQYNASGYYGSKPSAKQNTFGGFTSRGTTYRSDAGSREVFTGSRWQEREIKR